MLRLGIFVPRLLSENVMENAHAMSQKSALHFVVFALLFALVFTPLQPQAATKKRASGENTKYAAYVMDAETGQVLFSRYADKRLHPASLTKVMTLLMVFDALDAGTLKLDDRIYISRRAANMSPSKIGIPAGGSIRVRDAIKAMVTKSANDIACAVGEKIGGSESNFARMMNERARQIGMVSSNFVNASGWHSPNQVSSAKDMAMLAAYILKYKSHHYHYFSIKNFSYQGRNYHNHNRLMSSFSGMDGFKTGYTIPSGFNLIASAKRSGRRVIGVVFGGRTAQSRNDHMASILTDGFKKLADVRYASAQPVIDTPESAFEQGDTESNYGAVPAPMPKPETILRADAPMVVAALPPKVAAQPQRAAPEPKFTSLESLNVRLDEGKSKAATAPSMSAGQWGIQIGAFTSKGMSDQALAGALKKLPQAVGAGAKPQVVPLRLTEQSWIYRARLTGFTRDKAYAACAYFTDCVPIAPISEGVATIR